MNPHIDIVVIDGEVSNAKTALSFDNDAVWLVLDCTPSANSPALAVNAVFWITEVSFNLTVFGSGA